MTKPYIHFTVAIAILLFLGLLLTSQYYLPHYYIYNHTPSIPLGWYKLGDRDTTLSKGDTVAVCVQHHSPLDQYRTQGWFGNIQPSTRHPCAYYLLKEISAVAGEQAGCKHGQLTINGEDQGRCYNTIEGILLPRQPYKTIPTGYVFLTTRHPLSFDSRYFGVIDSNLLRPAHLVYEVKP